MNFDIEVFGRMVVMASLLTLMAKWNYNLWGWICWVAVGIILFMWVISTKNLSNNDTKKKQSTRRKK